MRAEGSHTGAARSCSGLRGDLSLSSAHSALSLQPGKLTEAFKYFLQGMGYSECWGWVGAGVGLCVPMCVC